MRVVTTGLLIGALLSPVIALAQGGKPANLCQELVAFVRQPEDATQAAGTPARLATAVTAQASGQPAPPPSAPGAPQSTSGQSGPVMASGPGAAGPQGESQNKAAPRGSTATAPGTASDKPAAPMPTARDREQVADAAGTNDLTGCRAAAQAMRRAGIVMPGPLLALSAMAPRLLESASRPREPIPGAGRPAPGFPTNRIESPP